MTADQKRLYFIDAMRAWAILMMLQGHFIDGLLDPVFRDTANPAYATWLYFRGVTAPVFFTVSGFIFTYLLLRAPRQGKDNPRLSKGLRRGLQLVLIGYLLRTNLFGLLKGSLYPAFFLVDVLHCIGLSLVAVVGLYRLSHRIRPGMFGPLLLATGLLLFLFEPVYKSWDYGWMPGALANYFTRDNGSVFTLTPWMGYTLLGGALAVLFRRYREDRHLYLKAIAASLAAGFLLIRYASPFFDWAEKTTGIPLFGKIVSNNYLFMRLGDVLLVFAVFMLLRGLMKSPVFLKIGQNTLSVYVIHFVLLYGSFTGIGLYHYIHHSLGPLQVVSGAIAFMVLCTWTALWYDRNEARITLMLKEIFRLGYGNLRLWVRLLKSAFRSGYKRLLRYLAWNPGK